MALCSVGGGATGAERHAHDEGGVSIYGNGSWRLSVYARNLASKMVNGSVWAGQHVFWEKKDLIFSVHIKRPKILLHFPNMVG